MDNNSTPAYVDPVSPIFIDSAVQAGIVHNADFNDPDSRQGVGYYHFNIRDGIRESAAKAMLSPVIGRRANLRMELGATVTRLLFDNTKVSKMRRQRALGLCSQ